MDDTFSSDGKMDIGEEKSEVCDNISMEMDSTDVHKIQIDENNQSLSSNLENNSELDINVTKNLSEVPSISDTNDNPKSNQIEIMDVDIKNVSNENENILENTQIVSEECQDVSENIDKLKDNDSECIDKDVSENIDKLKDNDSECIDKDVAEEKLKNVQVAEEVSEPPSNANSADVISIAENISINKFSNIENSISNAVSELLNESNVESSKKDSNTLDINKNSEDSDKESGKKDNQRMEDLEDASMDGAPEGDALGLLAETEGRERHSSDNEDDANSERDSTNDTDDSVENEEDEDVENEENEDIENADDEDVEGTDEEYEEEEEEDDEDIDEEDEDNPESLEEGECEKNELDSDNETLDQQGDESNLEPGEIRPSTLSICNVTSLAANVNGMDSLNDSEKDSIFNDDHGSEQNFIISSICTVDKETLQKLNERIEENEDDKETQSNLELNEANEECVSKSNDTIEDASNNEASESANEAETLQSIVDDECVKSTDVTKKLIEDSSQDDAASESLPNNLSESITESELEISQNKRKADDSLENISKKLDTKKGFETPDLVPGPNLDDKYDNDNFGLHDNILESIENLEKEILNDEESKKDVKNDITMQTFKMECDEIEMEGNNLPSEANEVLESKYPESESMDTVLPVVEAVNEAPLETKELNEVSSEKNDVEEQVTELPNDRVTLSKDFVTEDTDNTTNDVIETCTSETEDGLNKISRTEKTAIPNVAEVCKVGEKQKSDEASLIITDEAPSIPTEEASLIPTEEASLVPTEEASVIPTEETSLVPTEEASLIPTEEASLIPTEESSLIPTEESSLIPTEEASLIPTEESSLIPTEESSLIPTEESSLIPTDENKVTSTVDTSTIRDETVKSTVTTKTTPGVVFSLDSDDDETTSKKVAEEKSKDASPVKTPDPSSTVESPSDSSKTTEAKDTPKKPRGKVKCVNPVCCKMSDLQPCPLFLPSLYRAKDLNSLPKACQDCLDKGITLMEHLCSKLGKGECLIETDMPNCGELVEISDSESDDDDKENNKSSKKKISRRFKSMDFLTKLEQNFLNENLEDVFSKTWHKFRVQKQLSMCEDALKMKMESLDADACELGKMIEFEQAELDRMRKTLYDTFKAPTECRKEAIITENGDKIVESNLLVERRSARLKKAVKYNTEEESELSPMPATLPTADSVITEEPITVPDIKPELPPEGILPEHTMKVGDTVFAVKQSIFGAWCSAKIVQVLPKGTPLANGTLSLFSLVRVLFSEVADGIRAVKQVTGRQVAYPEPALVRYPIGTRIIALFKDKWQLKEAYYSGVVAEVPVKTNGFRYLVFFDDGYARYVNHSGALLVCERSDRVWEDVHPDSRDFVRKYMQIFPNQPMVRVQPGHFIRTEYNGKFWHANVISVDASLALIRFSEVVGAPMNREEWIYRGSTRLEPLFLELQAADRRAQGRHRASYATTNLSKNKNFPYVEYSRPDQPEEKIDSVSNAVELVDDVEAKKNETEDQQPTSRAVAKKSTVHKEEMKSKNRDQPPTHQLHSDQVKSKVVYYSPKVSIRPKKLVSHGCKPDCLNKDAIPLRELRTYNPLARPLLSGWQRLIIKYRGKRAIMYHAPCGRRLRSAEELHLYLRLTQSQMSVDLFDFDHWVHCLAEFVPTKCFVSKKDLSHGVEAVPVPCVNYYDHTLPEFSAYSTRRIPTQGVNLNLDEEFLCGCDCTDDCQDRDRCQCWQLTLEGAQMIGTSPDRVGYQYKRLLEPVPTGIYECNSRCKCAATCLNRVVQHPLQLKLQVFKTFNRGWGIRALNDVSRGTFLCIYAGNLLTDAVANVDGVTEGDEYLAELDYIEVVEKLKENYESDVPDEDKSDLDDLSDTETQSHSMNKDGKTGAHGESDEEFHPTSFKAKSTEANSRMTTRRQLKKSNNENLKNTKKSISIIEKEILQKIASEEKKIREERKSKDSDSLDGFAPVVDEFITISDDEEKREPSRFAAPEGLHDDEYIPRHRSVRSFFGKDEACYIMDAKVQGNLGRYLNHSCCPNVFVQNVFVDTHDPRFPWVAFFTLNHVRAGTELTWNYNYDVGSVPGKCLYCRCGASNCRGRLL